MTLTDRAPATGLTFGEVQEKWDTWATQLRDAIRRLRAHTEGREQESAGSIVKGALELDRRVSGNSERRRVENDLTSLMAIGHRVGLDHRSPKLRPLIDKLRELNARDVLLIEGTIRLLESSQNVRARIDASSHRIAAAACSRLAEIAGDDPMTATALLDSALQAADRAEISVEVLRASLQARLETASAWCQIAWRDESDQVRQMDKLGAFTVTVLDDLRPAEKRDTLLGMHVRLDPDMRLLSQKAAARVRRDVESACEPGFQGVVALLNSPARSLGLTPDAYRSIKKGFGELRGKRIAREQTAGGAESDLVECWNYLGELLLDVGPEAGKTPSTEPESDPSSDEARLDPILASVVKDVLPRVRPVLEQLYGRRSLLDSISADGTEDGIQPTRFLEFVCRNWTQLLEGRLPSGARVALQNILDAIYESNTAAGITSERTAEALAALHLLSVRQGARPRIRTSADR